jgi:hypothetical protein
MRFKMWYHIVLFVKYRRRFIRCNVSISKKSLCIYFQATKSPLANEMRIKPCIMTPLRSRKLQRLRNTKPSLSARGSGFTRTVKRGVTSRSGFLKFLPGKSIGFPRFKSKHQGHYSYTTNLAYGNIELASYLKLPKLRRVSVEQHRQVLSDYKLKSVSVNRSSLKYCASIL